MTKYNSAYVIRTALLVCCAFTLACAAAGYFNLISRTTVIVMSVSFSIGSCLSAANALYRLRRYRSETHHIDCITGRRRS